MPRTGVRAPWPSRRANPRRQTARRDRGRFLFALLQPVENAARRGLGRGLGNVEAAVHVGVDGAEDHGMDRHALPGQERAQRLRHVQRRRLRDRVAGNDRQGRERHQRQVVDDGSFGALQQRQERARHFEHAEQVDGQMLLDGVDAAQIVIDGDAGIVDEDVERPDLLGCTLDLRHIGDVQGQRRHAFIGDLQRRPAGSGVDALGATRERLLDKSAADAAIGAGDQDGLVGDVHVILLWVQARPGICAGLIGETGPEAKTHRSSLTFLRSVGSAQFSYRNQQLDVHASGSIGSSRTRAIGGRLWLLWCGARAARRDCARPHFAMPRGACGCHQSTSKC